MDTADTLADLLAHHPEPLFIADRGGVVTLLSQALERLLGPEAKVGTRLADRVHTDDRSAFDAAWIKIGEGAEPTRFDFRLEGAGGAYRRVQCSARRSPARGDVHGLLREVSLEREEAKLFRVMLERLPIVVWVIDRDGTFTFQDGKGLEAMGMKPGQLLGQNLFQLYPQSSRADFEKVLAGEAQHSLRDSYGVPVENWTIPVHDAHGEGEGEVVSAMNVTLDITNARRAEVELREKLALIERQQAVINALSTPIIEIWDKVLTLPMLGVIDTTRAGQVMEQVLAQISQKGARFAILDLTGVEAVDSGTASHLLKLIQAIRLLGAEGVITGIRPIVAQTMVMLGVDLETIVTCANLRQGLLYCVKRLREDAPRPGKGQQGPS